MKNKSISERISLMSEFDSSIYLHAHCSCGHEDHTQTLVVECDDDEIVLLIYSKIFTPYPSEPNYNDPLTKRITYFYRNWKTRFKWIVSILFRGYVEAENVFTMDTEKQMDDFLFAIAQAKNKIKRKKQCTNVGS